MITINHIISDIREIASSGGNPNEFKIEDEQIEYWIDEIRAMLIYQNLSKRNDISDSWIQYIPCLELELVDSSNCDSDKIGCQILKSKLEIPRTIQSSEDNSIISVSTLSGKIIAKSNPIKYKYQQYNKYTSNDRSWFIKNDYLYINNEIDIEKVEIAGLFDSPRDLIKFKTCEGGPSYSSEFKYPVDYKMASDITDIVIKTKVVPFMQFPMDNDNNANGNTNQMK
jgi:hypothetical protein